MGYDTARFVGADFFNNEVRQSFYENTNANNSSAVDWNCMGRNSASSDF